MYINVYLKRKEKRKTQEEIADAIGMKQDTYQKKEKGKYDFTLREAIKLAEYHNTTLDELFKDDFNESA